MLHPRAYVVDAYGHWMPPSGRVAAYVRSTGAQEGDDYFAQSGLLVRTLAEGLARCRIGYDAATDNEGLGKNDVVYVLEGHRENITAATQSEWSTILQPGTQIISCGVPGSSNNATLTWTATDSRIVMSNNDVTFAGFNFVWNAVDGVVSPFRVETDGIRVIGNHVLVADANAGALKGFDITSNGGFRVIGNRMLSVGEAHPMTGAAITLSGDSCVARGNYISAANPGTSVLGLINVSGPASNARVIDNVVIQLETAGTALFGITAASGAATGTIARNFVKIGTNVVATTSGISVGAAALVGMGVFENYCQDATATSGVLSPVAAA